MPVTFKRLRANTVRTAYHGSNGPTVFIVAPFKTARHVFGISQRLHPAVFKFQRTKNVFILRILQNQRAFFTDIRRINEKYRLFHALLPLPKTALSIPNRNIARRASGNVRLIRFFATTEQETEKSAKPPIRSKAFNFMLFPVKCRFFFDYKRKAEKILRLFILLPIRLFCASFC